MIPQALRLNLASFVGLTNPSYTFPYLSGIVLTSFSTQQPFSGSSFDLGPSLMDEVFKALGGSSSTTDPISLDPPASLPPLTPTHPTQALLEDNETHNVKNELKEIASKITGKDNSKKKQATVRPTIIVIIIFIFIIILIFTFTVGIIFNVSYPSRGGEFNSN